MNTENVKIHTLDYFSALVKKEILTLLTNVNEPGGHCMKRSKLGTERPLPHDPTCGSKNSKS